MDRRSFLRTSAVASAGAVALGSVPACAAAGGTAAAGAPAQTVAPGAAAASTGGGARTMTYRHSVTRWPFARIPLDELARAAVRLGIQSVELLEPNEWAVVKAHGLACAMGYAPAGDPATRLTKGWNRAEHHAWLVPGYQEGIRLAAAAGVPNVICFSGNRDGLSDARGLETCAAGLRQIMPDAERLGVTISMELFNTKVDHPDYQCDSTAWGVALVERVGSERFKLLYDIYHMQIQEGDVIRTIRRHHDKFSHYHTAGVPGRNEIDGSQELHYPAIMRALAEVGFTGYVGQEFIPKRDPLTSLAEAVRICTV